MKIFISKYALSRGVFEVEADVDGNGFAVVRKPGSFSEYYHGEGRDWCRTREQAFQVAEAMRVKKIASLKQQISKLKMLTFAVGEGAND